MQVPDPEAVASTLLVQVLGAHTVILEPSVLVDPQRASATLESEACIASKLERMPTGVGGGGAQELGVLIARVRSTGGPGDVVGDAVGAGNGADRDGGRDGGA